MHRAHLNNPSLSLSFSLQLSSLKAAPTTEDELSVPVSDGEMSIGGLSVGGGGDESFAESVSDGSYVSSSGGSFDGGGAGGEVMW